MSFSIKNLRNQPSTMTLLHPVTKKPLVNNDGDAVQIDLVGMDSKAFADAKVAAELKTMELYRATNTVTPEQQRDLTFDLFVGLIQGWNETAAKFFADELDGDGTFSLEKSKSLFSRPEYYWIVQQIEAAINDRQRYFTQQ
jgi:hypothetical protein